MRLTKKQTMALDILEDDQTTELLFGGGAGGGKSAVGCYWLLKNCFRYPGSRWLMGRSKLKSLKETTLNTFFDICNLQKIDASLYNYNAQSGTITFVNKSQIILKDLFLYPSDPNFDSLGSLEITGAFVDECNQIVAKAWNIVKSRIRYRLDELGLIPKILGTCNPAKNWVYTDFYKPSRNKELPFYKKFIQSLVTDNPYISHHYVDSLSKLDKVSQERLRFGNWEYDDDPRALIGFDAITDLFSNDHVIGGNKYITADIARYGADKTVIGFWNGFRLEKIVTINKNSIPEAADAIRRMKDQYGLGISQVLVDEDGIGGGVKDILRCRGFVANTQPTLKENFANLKSQCYFKLADVINDRQMYVHTDDMEIKQTIIEELELVKQTEVDADKKSKVMPKEEVKELLGRSPDYSDMMMMRMYFELRPKLGSG